ncbi:MAG: hypothetical protein WBI28_04890 [Candidatus Omnitrophota bacterium]
MKIYAVVLAAVGLLVLNLATGVFASDLAWEDISRGNLNLKTVLVETDNPQIIYIGSRAGIFKSEDGGGSWRSIFSAKGTNRGVNFLLFASDDKNSLYAATGNGLYFSSNRGRNWNRIFKGKNSFENECTGLAVLPYVIYLGTKSGLFLSKDNGRSWHKESGLLGNNQILNIFSNLREPDYIYIASLDGVFKTSDAGKSWERIFIAHPVENTDENNEVIEDHDEPGRFSGIKYVTIDPNNLNCLYVATSKGVYISQNKGRSWDLLTDYGLLSKEIKFLLISLKSTIYAVTKSAIFEYTNERWHELSLGLTAEDISSLAKDSHGNLYAAASNGLFKANFKDTPDTNKNSILEFYYKDEPKISEVQNTAIKYAEVEPEKIIKWRKQAARKALLPQVSIGIDRNSTGLWHWEGGSTTKTDDDILRRGRDSIDWDLTLSWDLSELIWNNDQTSIDVRSRLTVQLRDDVLDEVTKLYFERIRVKMELDNLSIEDRKKRFEKELKLQELTAQLDGLTGGYFSKHINSSESDS